MLLLEIYFQNCKACFGRSECEWVKNWYCTKLHNQIRLDEDRPNRATRVREDARGVQGLGTSVGV